jgi:hypothetical protein
LFVATKALFVLGVKCPTLSHVRLVLPIQKRKNPREHTKEKYLRERKKR